MSALPAALSAELDRLAALTETPRGAIIALAREHGRSADSLRVLLYQRRHPPPPLKGRADRALLASLTLAQRVVYRLYRSKGYRSGEALDAVLQS